MKPINKTLAVCIIATLLLNQQAVFAQARPQQSLYLMNYSFLNPAMTGVNNYGDIKIGVRRQWVGVSGAPATNWLSGNLPLGKRKLRTKTDEKNKGETKTETKKDSSNKKAKLPYVRPSVMDRGHGLGFTMFQDNIGPYKTSNLGISYAYHLPVGNGVALSMGVSTGFGQIRYDRSGEVHPETSTDPATLTPPFSRKLTPDVTAGLLLYTNKFFVGTSVLQLVPSKFIDSSFGNQSKITPQLVATTGYSFKLSDFGTRLVIAGLMATDFVTPTRYDVNAKLHFKEIGWGGLSFRYQDAVGAFFGFNVSPKFSFTYLYENSLLSSINVYSNASHELMMAFRFLKKGKSPASKIDW